MDAKEVHAWLSRNGTRRTVAGMARFGIVARQAYGVTMAQLLGLKKRIGKDHALALELWESGWYEARLLAALVGEPERLTRRQMNAWAARLRELGRLRHGLLPALRPVAVRVGARRGSGRRRATSSSSAAASR